MKKIVIFLPILFLMFFLSCSRFVNLGDSEMSSGSGENNLPEELSDSENNKEDKKSDSEETESENSNDYGDSGDKGNTGNSGNSANSGNSGNSGSIEEFSDDDNSSTLKEYPFDENFTNEMCSCGFSPQYDPVCCSGNISVYNPCFANCYAIHSSGKICSSYVSGICDSTKDSLPDEDFTEFSDSYDDADTNDDDSDKDSYIEINDDDISEETPVNNECGCYPQDTIFHCCYVNGTVLISSCLSECHCKGGFSSCF